MSPVHTDRGEYPDFIPSNACFLSRAKALRDHCANWHHKLSNGSIYIRKATTRRSFFCCFCSASQSAARVSEQPNLERRAAPTKLRYCRNACIMSIPILIAFHLSSRCGRGLRAVIFMRSYTAHGLYVASGKRSGVSRGFFVSIKSVLYWYPASCLFILTD